MPGARYYGWIHHPIAHTLEDEKDEITRTCSRKEDAFGCRGRVSARRRVLAKDALGLWVRGEHRHTFLGMGWVRALFPERVHANLKQEEIAGISLSSSLSSDNSPASSSSPSNGHKIISPTSPLKRPPRAIAPPSLPVRPRPFALAYWHQLTCAKQRIHLNNLRTLHIVPVIA